MILAATNNDAIIEFGLTAGGVFRFIVEDLNLAGGPLGIMLYLLFVPPYWFIPERRRAGYLASTSVLFSLLLVGPAYAATIGVLAATGFLLTRVYGPRGQTRAVGLILAGLYLLLLLFPRPLFLPLLASKEPVYFYLHWAGLGYLFLRTYHVLADVAAGRMGLPGIHDYLAYLLFAPTLRMGPLYRYPEFARQMRDGPRAHRSFVRAGGRLFTAILRLGIMQALLEAFPPSRLYTRPESLSFPELLVYIVAGAMPIYLWISAYVDLSIAVGRVTGFNIPDNFNYPWIATSVDEFWRRWHITLGNWLKDYLFTPLVRHRWHYFWAFVMTFLFCGVWHGLYLSYALWGLSQGVGMGVRRAWAQYWKGQKQQGSSLYRRLAGYGLVDSRLNTAGCWLLTFTYQVLTIHLFLLEDHLPRLDGSMLIAHR